METGKPTADRFPSDVDENRIVLHAALFPLKKRIA